MLIFCAVLLYNFYSSHTFATVNSSGVARNISGEQMVGVYPVGSMGEAPWGSGGPSPQKLTTLL